MDILDKIDQESGEHLFERISRCRKKLPKTIFPFDLKPKDIIELSEDVSVPESPADILLLHVICEILKDERNPEVLFVNLKHKIKIPDFAAILKIKYGQSDEEVSGSLKKLHILAVFNLQEFHLCLLQVLSLIHI